MKSPRRVVALGLSILLSMTAGAATPDPSGVARAPREVIRELRPACANARGEEASACARAEGIAVLDARHATTWFLSEWSTFFGERARIQPDGIDIDMTIHGGGGEASHAAGDEGVGSAFGGCPGPGIVIALPVFAVVGIIHAVRASRLRASVREAGVIAEVLRAIYAREGDEYSQRMTAALSQADLHRRSNFETFATSDALALGMTSVADLLGYTTIAAPTASAATLTNGEVILVRRLDGSFVQGIYRDSSAETISVERDGLATAIPRSTIATVSVPYGAAAVDPNVLPLSWKTLRSGDRVEVSLGNGEHPTGVVTTKSDDELQLVTEAHDVLAIKRSDVRALSKPPR
jgi:hypothetical protein